MTMPSMASVVCVCLILASVPYLTETASVGGRFHYMRLPQKDALCEDSHLQRVATTDEVQLKALCDQDSSCMGFNGRGELKRNTRAVCIRDDLEEGAVLYSKTSMHVSSTFNGSPEISVVPLPADYNLNAGNSILATNFSVSFPQSPLDVKQFLEAAVERYYGLVLTHRSSKISATGDITGIEVTVKSQSLDLGLDTDESYQLSVPASGAAQLTATTVYGALRGMETLSQLIRFDLTTGMYHIANTPLQVNDKPRFAHRGVLLDTARHYHSTDMLKRFVDSLSHAKFNVFHWHIVDTQAFPLQLHTLPALVKGAFTPQEVYTPEDVADIVQYCKMRGIRVIPEFDTPGHAGSWCVGYPDICPSANCTQPLNPATNKTFDLISTLLKESSGIFTDDYIHLGGDEVREKCWESVPAVADWLKEKNYTTDDAYKYFVTRTHAITSALGRKSIFWEEVFNHFGGELEKDTIFQVWLNHATAAKIVAEGYHCILSNNNKWYLPHLQVSWQDMYLNDPFSGITEPAQQKLVLGGEACMWGETVDDSDLFNTVWPRAAAVAERLWSPAWANNTFDFMPRLSNFRCLLNARGYSAAPVHNNVARSAPPQPGSCMYQ